MPTEQELQEQSKKKGYDVRDVPASPVVMSIAALVALMFAGFVGGKVFHYVFEATEVKSRPEVSSLARREAVEGPLLQAHPEVELKAYLDEQKHILASYAWVDREHGVVRIPIEEAMKLVARDGFPKWKAETAKVAEEAPEPEAKPEPAHHAPAHHAPAHAPTSSASAHHPAHGGEGGAE